MSFKKGDIVHYIRKGEGKVTHISKGTDYPIGVTWKNTPNTVSNREQFTSDGKIHKTDIYPSLSHVDYHKAVITERPIDYNDYIGKWGYFSPFEGFSRGVVIGKLYSYNKYEANKEKFELDDITGEELYEYFKPLTEEQIEILNLK